MKRWIAAIFLTLAAAAAFLDVLKSPILLQVPNNRLLQSQSSDGPLQKYTQASIESLRSKMPTLEFMVLVFDGQVFRTYSTGHANPFSFRYVRAIPLMVHALRTSSPERFKPGQPVFQLVFTTADFLNTQCVNSWASCGYTKDFPPIISFSTMHRDESILPTAKAFPNPHYITCLYGWKIAGENTCKWQEVDKTLQWDNLTPTVLWRGSDFMQFINPYDEYKNTNNGWMQKTFTPAKMKGMSKNEIIDLLLKNWSDLSPRWRSAALTLKTKVDEYNPPFWIDSMFTGSSNEKLHEHFMERGLQVSETKLMDAKEMSKARYQIDYGGGGGTTWQGTLTKLQMPGVLFHHETPTKDWFYDMMEPWKHYIPVGAQLADLWQRYTWAQEHPEEAKAISAEASKLAEELLSEEYMKKVYDDLFVKYLGKVVEAYEPLVEAYAPNQEETWADWLARYQKRGIKLEEISVCPEGKTTCRTEWYAAKFVDFF